MQLISFAFALFFVLFALSWHLASRLDGSSALGGQRVLLLVGSLVFYGYADLRFLPFLFYIILISYLSGRFARRRAQLLLFLLLDFAPLLFFKYSPKGWQTRVLFPLGLSFISFQSISYIVDAYKGKIAPEQKLLDIALFISFFPTVSSGPVQRAEKLLPQLKQLHRFDYDNAADGMRLFAWGMLKKLMIADRLARYVNYVYSNAADQHGLALLLATVLYSFQIYCDFSGYSDMAAGAARFLGFDVGKNFDHPYLSKSVGEFWRRWHISLSSWLRDYVYIPLGGSRVPLPHVYLNLLATFLVSGIWHGSGWSFVAWGLLHGLYLCVERATKSRWEQADVSDAFRIAATFCLVAFAWVFFRAPSARTALLIYRKIAFSPLELATLMDYQKTAGMKNAVRTLFAISPESCGNLRGMGKMLTLVVMLLAAEIATMRKSGLALIRSLTADLRWLAYIVCVIVLLELLPLKMTFEEQQSYSTNFIYQGF